MGDIKFTKSLLLISLFALAIIGYTVGFGIDNGSVVTIDQDAQLSTLNSSIQDNLDDFLIATNDSSNSFSQTSITGEDQTTITGGEFKLNFLSMKNTMSNIFDSVNKNIFGGSKSFGFVLGAFISFLVFVGVRYIWKTWKGGNPD